MINKEHIHSDNTDEMHWLEPLFAGPYSENNDLFEKILLEHIREHFYWRRNFHPEDLPSHDIASQYHEDFQITSAKMRNALHELSSILKKSVPFFHPRYMGHMASDLFMPGIIAQMLTQLYNPNNVSIEAGAATISMELEVGKQFSKLFGFNIDENQYPCAWGHLTSGGTVANIEALWNIRSGRFICFALSHACRVLEIELDHQGKLKLPLNELNDWELFNVPLDTALELWNQYHQLGREKNQEQLFETTINDFRPEKLGMAIFSQNYWTVKPPMILVPKTAHYSWEKATQLLALGAEQLVKVPVDRHMRMDKDAMERILKQALVKQIPILAVVCVLGSTEFGTIDPVHEVVKLQQQFNQKGLYFPIHVDAAWGGYLATLFRDEKGHFISRKNFSDSYQYFPSQHTYRAFKSLQEVDSITVDPHKMGYLPFGVGGVIFRNKLLCQTQKQSAAYVFDNQNAEKAFNNLGQFILEGSKPGASAAAVYVSQKVMPLHRQGMGKIIAISIKNTEYFADKFIEFQKRMKKIVNVIMPVDAETNLVTLSINPVWNRDLAIANQLTKAVYQSLKMNVERPVQFAQFLGSSTKIFRYNLTHSETTRLSMELGVDSNSFVEKVEDQNSQASFLFALRHTLMNPWLIQETKNYIDMYFDFLEICINELLNQDAFQKKSTAAVKVSGGN